MILKKLKTRKENFLKLRHDGTPEYVPFYSITGAPYKGESACAGAMLPLYNSTQFQPGGKDMWGVPYAAASEGVASTMPDTRIVMLEDISDWSKVVQFPKANDVDVEKVYQVRIAGEIEPEKLKMLNEMTVLTDENEKIAPVKVSILSVCIISSSPVS